MLELIVNVFFLYSSITVIKDIDDLTKVKENLYDEFIEALYYI